MILITCAHFLEAKSIIDKFQLQQRKSAKIPYKFYQNNEITLVLTGEDFDNILISTSTLITFLKTNSNLTNIYNFGICAALNLSLIKEEILLVEKSYCQKKYNENIEPKHYIATNNKTRYKEAKCLTVTSAIFDMLNNSNLRNQFDILDQELWAIAKVAQSFHIPWTSYKMVSDFANADLNMKKIKILAQKASLHFSNILDGLLTKHNK